MILRALWLVLALTACDGLGRPIVGTQPIPDGGSDEACEVTPACVPVRTVDPGLFMIPAERLVPPVREDCDADGVTDAMDTCVGVPNERQGTQECAAARASCDALRSGSPDLAGADLRGCRIDEPLEVRPGLSLRGADLSCASLTIVEPAGAAPHVLDLTQANLTGASLAIESEVAPVIVDVGRSQLRDTFLRATGGVRLQARESVLANATLALEPGGSAFSSAPLLEITASDLDNCALHEAPSAWPGRVRIERSSMRATTIDVAVLELVGASVISSNLGASELFALDAELTSSAVSVGYGAMSMCELRDVIFARCEDLLLTGGMLQNIDVPLCEPDHLRIVEADVVDAHLAGGVWLIDSSLSASILGGGPTSTAHTTESDLDAVTICDLGAAAFEGGELRCVKCEADAFMNGTSVCLAGAHVIERGCPAIELAPECP